VAIQRNTFRDGKMSKERQQHFESLPKWAWNPGEAQWEEGYQRLLEYVQRVGNASVASDHVESDGYPLGGWVHGQRTSYKEGKLAAERVLRLESVDGWIWDHAEAKWQDGITHLQQYVEREGHARVPKSHIEPDGYPLGRWINNQRAKRKKLTRQRRTDLEAVPGWQWKARSAS
jgi:hypothetical protein